MPFINLVDPELVDALDFFPAELMTAIGDDPPKARVMFQPIWDSLADDLKNAPVTIEERTIPGPEGEIGVVIYQPPTPAPRGGLLWIHGGGYIVGSGRNDPHGIGFAEHAGCTVVSVDYRLAPESPYPAAISDCFGALCWLAENTDELGVDPARIAIGGASAGGGLTAALALYNRDHGGPDLAYQLLIYPMIDDRHETPSGREITHPTVWNRELSLKAWRMYLGAEYGRESVSPYAAAARARDLSGLPPALVTVGMLDLFRDENIDYAQRLMAAGVPTELQVYPGMYHGAEMSVMDAAVSIRMRTAYRDALRRAIG
ncbi:MAG: alpha/beta hydrolase [Chloroflexi bacterium]|nr:alpha/beta hydrolase [Chloroflexota bacterium]